MVNIAFCDIGTGSGCIAVTLACEYSQAHIVATDISKSCNQNSTVECRETPCQRPFNIPFGRYAGSIEKKVMGRLTPSFPIRLMLPCHEMNATGCLSWHMNRKPHSLTMLTAFNIWMPYLNNGSEHYVRKDTSSLKLASAVCRSQLLIFSWNKSFMIWQITCVALFTALSETG